MAARPLHPTAPDQGRCLAAARQQLLHVLDAHVELGHQRMDTRAQKLDVTLLYASVHGSRLRAWPLGGDIGRGASLGWEALTFALT